MAIAYLSHAEAILFNIGDSDIFIKLITLARTVGPDYFPPNCNMIGGELLDINWKSYQTKTTKDLMAEADVFGLVFLRYLSTIKVIPLINIIESSFNVPVAVLDVKDYSKHLSQVGNRDATFISEAFRPYLEQYDEQKIRTDLDFFDSEFNIQKAGKIPAVSYPWITVLHGVKHVLSLFFYEIGKLLVIKVRQRYSYKYTLVPYKHTLLHNTSNLEYLFTVGANTEVQAHVPLIQGFLLCPTRSNFPPFKYAKQRAQPSLSLSNTRLLCRLILKHSCLSPVQAALSSYISWSALGRSQE